MSLRSALATLAVLTAAAISTALVGGASPATAATASGSAAASAGAEQTHTFGWAFARVGTRHVEVCSELTPDNAFFAESAFGGGGFAEVEYTTSLLLTFHLRTGGHRCNDDSTFLSTIDSYKICYGATGVRAFRTCTKTFRSDNSLF